MILKGGSEIEAFLQAPGPGVRCALIHGRDLGVVRERAGALAGAVTDRPDDPFDVAILTTDDLEADVSRLFDELCALSLMGGRRLVRLKLAEDRGEAIAIAAEALAGHAAGKFNPDAFLIIEAPSLAKTSPLATAGQGAAACAVIACYADEPADIKQLVRKALAAENLGLSSDALELFVSRLPQDRGVTRAEIERLILFLGPRGGRSAEAEELEAFVGVEPEASLAQAAEDAFGGRIAAAQAGLRRAALQMEAGAPAVRALGYHLGRLRRALVLRQAGADPRSAARSAGVFWKNEGEFLRQARAWSLAAVEALSADILAADRDCKHSGAPAGLIAERLALSIAARAQRHGL